MRREDRTYLYDIQQAASLIAQFTAGRTFDDYLADPMLRAAVERVFEIIGEALSQLARRSPSVAARITDYRTIIDFRNVLIHGYAHISDRVVWGNVEMSLPILRREVEGLLNEP